MSISRHLRNHRREFLGVVVATVGIGIVCAALLPARPHLPSATPALVLVLPVIAGVVVGGFTAGIAAAVVGFVAFDLVFIPPYYTLAITAGEDWLALGVYIVVVLLVARLVAALRSSEMEARQHAEATRRIFELSDALIADSPFEEFLDRVVTTFLEAFSLNSVALLLPRDSGLEVAALAGEPLAEAELARIAPHAGVPLGRSAVHLRRGTTIVVPLTTSAGPVGLLALGGASLRAYDEALLLTYSNQVALALERSQLRDQAFRTDLLEEIDRWRDALIGAVSHDLRTPLAVIKAAVSDLLDEDIAFDESSHVEMLNLVEEQSDRLARLVVNILDMTRIRAGALEVRREPVALVDLVGEALAGLPRKMSERVVLELSDPKPVVQADHVLIAQVLANLIENADRHAPLGAAIEITATKGSGGIEVNVTDHGPGVAADERDRIFDMFSRVSGAGRAGLGLAICKAFVEAHGGSIWVTSAPGGGAQFTFTLEDAR